MWLPYVNQRLSLNTPQMDQKALTVPILAYLTTTRGASTSSKNQISVVSKSFLFSESSS